MVFFVRGMSLNGREILINPDQVLYIHPAALQHKRTVLVLTHGKRLTVDQNVQMVRNLFDDYLRAFAETRDDDARASEPRGSMLKLRTPILSS
jgi:uncharacterized protein YlzI (FlbEa/FlbD family)